MSLVLIKISKNGPKWTHFEKIACEIAKSKFLLILEDGYPPDLFFGFRFWDIRNGGSLKVP